MKMRSLSVVSFCLLLMVGLSWEVGAFNEKDLTKFKEYGNCVKCDLSGANLIWLKIVRADLTGADLTGADLTEANLTVGNLTGVNLTDANLTRADLTRANLEDANLSNADLTEVKLEGAKFFGVNLTEVKLEGAKLFGANLSGANLTGAILNDVDLTWANLTGANLTGAILNYVDLDGVTLTGVNLTGVVIDNWTISTNSYFSEGWRKKNEIEIKTLAEEKRKEQERLAEEKRKEQERLAEEKRKEQERLALEREEKKRIAKEQRKIELEKIALNPGFRDLKPGLTRKEINLLKVCSPELSPNNLATCYDIDNIKFQGEFRSGVLRVLRIDLGPYVGGGFIQSVTEMVEGDPILNMRGTLGEKYAVDYDYSERDRQLFNEREKVKLYTVFAKGQVALVLIQVEKDYSIGVRSYVEYRDKETAKTFLEANRPKKAKSSDF